MKKVISALICAAMLAAMIAVGIPAAAGATFFKTAELLELKEHIEDDAGMNEFATVQGGCTDGRYAYFAVQQANTTILKYDMKTWKLADKAEKMNSLGHANDMTYNQKLDRIFVANNGPDYHILTVLDPDTLKKVGTVKLKLEVYGIAYNPEKDIYVVGISGGYQFALLNSDFKVIKKFKGKNTGYTRQGCDCDQNYIYFSQSGGDNIVAVYDYNGKYVDSVSIGHKHEVENIFHVGSYFYTTLHHYGNSLQRIGLSNQTEIRYNVYYDPGDGVGKMKPTSVHYGHSIPLRKNTLRKDGYFFGGWRASRSMDGKYLGFRKFSDVSEWLDQEDVYTYDMYQDRDLVAATVKFGNVTMTPFWISNVYHVVFDPGNSESGWMQDAAVRYHDEYRIPENEFEKPGYIFAGYTAYRDYDDKYFGFRKGAKKPEWLEKQDMDQQRVFKPGEKVERMTYDGTVYLTPIFKYAFTFNENQTTLKEYIGVDRIVRIPSPGRKLSTIAAGAFKDNTIMTVLHIPETVNRLEPGAIDNCSELEKVFFKERFPDEYATDSIIGCDTPAICIEHNGQIFHLGYAGDTLDAEIVRLNAGALKAMLEKDQTNTNDEEVVVK